MKDNDHEMEEYTFSGTDAELLEMMLIIVLIMMMIIVLVIMQVK